MTLRSRFLSLLLLTLLVSCGGEPHQDLRNWMDTQAKSMKPNVPPLPEIKPFPVVDYSGSDLLSPFDSAKVLQLVAKVPPSQVRGGRREPLEAFPLETIEMVGVIQQGNEFLGLVKVSDQIYKVRVGNYMGQNFGVITSIDANSIKLKELIQDQIGWTEHMSSLQLVTPAGGK